MAKYVVSWRGHVVRQEVQVVEFNGTAQELEHWLEDDENYEKLQDDDDWTGRILYAEDDNDWERSVEEAKEWEGLETEDGRKVVDLPLTKLA